MYDLQIFPALHQYEKRIKEFKFLYSEKGTWENLTHYVK